METRRSPCPETDRRRAVHRARRRCRQRAPHGAGPLRGAHGKGSTTSHRRGVRHRRGRRDDQPVAALDVGIGLMAEAAEHGDRRLIERRWKRSQSASLRSGGGVNPSGRRSCRRPRRWRDHGCAEGADHALSVPPVALATSATIFATPPRSPRRSACARRLQGHLDGDRLLARRRAPRPRRGRTPRRRRSACGRRPRRRARSWPPSPSRSTTKAKSRLTGWKSESYSAGLVLVGFWPAARGSPRGSARSRQAGPPRRAAPAPSGGTRRRCRGRSSAPGGSCPSGRDDTRRARPP